MEEIEVFVLVDSDGSYVAHEDEGECHTRAEDGGLVPCRRLIRVVINVPTPEPIEVEATLPAELAKASVTVS